ncbi:MAG TPA: heparinase II/III family protein [bacterium]|nr:heparinase II/III family protein [bacterium]HPN33367.1 heparinase II/III family protein [bacterium]
MRRANIFSSIFILFFFLLAEGHAARRPAIMANERVLSRLDQILVKAGDYHPFPTWAERDGWQVVADSVRRMHIQAAEPLIGYRWPELPATLFLEFKREGNRSRYEKNHFDRRTRLAQLLLAECLEGRRRFLDDICNGIWAICEESFWGVPAHMSAQKAGVGLPDVSEPIVDLFAAETASLMAWTHYLLGAELDSVSPLLRPRMEKEIQRRLLEPCRSRDFGWMGFPDRTPNNWNPWINSNWLACVLLMEKNQEQRVQDIAKILRSLDRFLEGYGDDGGCDEGPSYWGRAGASLFDNLELLHGASRGAIDYYSVPLIQEIGRYIYRVQIAGLYFVNFADAPGVLTPPAELIYRYGERIQDPLMKNMALSLPRSKGVGRIASLGRELPALFTPMPAKDQSAQAPLVRDHFFKDLQVMVARSQAGSAQGLYVAAKGGHNAESHNHNDVGNFILYQNGQPMIVDAGVGVYTAKTFSPQRYELWTMQSAYHNLPTIDGVMQQNGRAFQASAVKYYANESRVLFQLEIQAAYPTEANLTHWLRSIELVRNREVIVREQYTLSKPAKEIVLSLLTPCRILPGGNGRLKLASTRFGDQPPAELTLVYDGKVFQVKTEELVLDDPNLQASWGDKLTRIQLVAENPRLRADWTVRFRE